MEISFYVVILIILLIQHGTTTNANNISYCNRKWPTLDLFLPMNLHQNTKHPRYYEFETMFLRTFLLFFPLQLSNVSLTVAVDEELKGTSAAIEVNNTLKEVENLVPGGIKLIGLPVSQYYRSGYDRQQFVMFWADNFTNKEYVGFLDSDVAFITLIDREDLFEDGKPVVNGRSGYHPAGDGLSKWSYGTFMALGILEPFKCMSYFPVIIKTEHLKELRDFISHYHKLSFNQAFLVNVSSQPYSQFAIMCTYLFHYRRDDYKWYIHTETPDWDGKNPAPHPGQDNNFSLFSPEMYIAKPRIATHVGHRRCPSNPIVSLHLYLN